MVIGSDMFFKFIRKRPERGIDLVKELPGSMMIMRLRTIIMVVGFILFPFSGESAMEEMTNDSLKQVEGNSRLSTFPDRNSEKDIMDVDQKESEFSRFESEIMSLRNSRDYIRFLLLLNKLEKISKKENYEEVMDSKYFLILCSNMVNFSKHCHEHLTTLETTVADYKMKELVRSHCKLFVKINHFYQCVSNYQSGKGESPDLKELIAEIRFGQDFFEAEFNKLKSLKY
jgi:hypothetical protein